MTLDDHMTGQMLARPRICPRAQALNRHLRQAARDQARRAIAGTPGGAMAARELTTVPADDAGESYLSAADGNIAHLRASGLLTARQCDAAAHLARLWGLGGHHSPWRLTGGTDRLESDVEAARREYRDLVDAAPMRCRPSLDVLSMGEWIVAYDPLPLWRDGLDVVADRLRLAPEVSR
jgi:hypothetical protein